MNTVNSDQENKDMQMLSEVNRNFENIAGSLRTLRLQNSYRALCRAYHEFEHEVFLRIKQNG